MTYNRIRAALLVVTASVGLTGCASYYGDPGYGYGPGNGYGGVSVGYSAGYGYGGYGNGYGGYGNGYYGGAGYGSPYYAGNGYPYGGGYGASYYGWNNGFYYPGTGYYVYDRSGRRQSWSESQRRYWESRRNQQHGSRDNWTGFRTGPVRTTSVAPSTGQVRQVRQVASPTRADSARQTVARRDQRRANRQARRESRPD